MGLGSHGLLDKEIGGIPMKKKSQSKCEASKPKKKSRKQLEQELKDRLEEYRDWP